MASDVSKEILGGCHLFLLLVYGLCSEILISASSTDWFSEAEFVVMVVWYHRQSRLGSGMLSALPFWHSCPHSQYLMVLFLCFHPVIHSAFVFLSTVAGMLQVSSSDLSTALTSDIQYFKGNFLPAFAITCLSLFPHTLADLLCYNAYQLIDWSLPQRQVEEKCHCCCLM